MSDQEKPSATENADNQSKHPSSPSRDTKTKEMNAIINPDIEFVNRTLP